MALLKEIEINQSTPYGNGKVFDWDKAAKIIKERKPETASAGLAEDWFWTGGTIYKNGRPVKSATYLASSWATPVLLIDGEEIDCYQPKWYQGWDEDTKWPESALKILDSKEEC